MKVKKIFVLDVDGVMTTGSFFYSKSGKVYKEFGPHDSDGLKKINGLINFFFITADKRGFGISKKRIVEDMGYSLKLISEESRYSFLEKKIGFKNLIYMGDGIYDAPILKKCFLGIAPKNARVEARKSANYVTSSNSGKGAVLDACLYIQKKIKKNEI